MLAGAVAFLGIGMFAIPTGILGSAFMEDAENKAKICPHCGKLPE